MFGMFGGLPGGGGGRFEAHYRCYPVTFIDKSEAERGDKIFLPPSALDRLAQLHIEYPMLFQVENPRESRTTHCGVLEFIADEGMAYLPYWMMQNLLLQEGDVITLRSATLPKGSFVKLQPHSTDFLDISNPRAVLETTLRNFSCLTVGDTIPIHYNNKSYFIDIIEAKPENAISVIETDCNVDFAQPLDYIEPEKREDSASAPMITENSIGSVPSQPDSEVAVADQGPSFVAFAGSGRRLDGKAVTESKPVVIPLAAGSQSSRLGIDSGSGSAPNGGGSLPKSGGSMPGKKKAGKLMFKDRLAARFDSAGAGAHQNHMPSKPEMEKKEPENSFKAFQGTSHKLK